MKKQPDNSNFENKQGRWIGNYGRKSATHHPRTNDYDGFTDQNITDGVQQNSSQTGYVDNSADD
ncbi:MAG TPA: hypothetical protein VGE26_03880 [Sphingobacteriaceae bacterium]